MDRKVLQKHSLYKDCGTFDFAPEEIKEDLLSDSEFDRIFREIYQVDEETGLPKGDFAYYMSRDGNPQVKEWLINNLLAPRASKLGSSVDGVTDDMIAEFSRSKGESVEDYAARLSGLRDSALQEIEEFKKSQNV